MHLVTTPKLATWGSFDCLHDGHKKFLSEASKLCKLYFCYSISKKLINIINKKIKRLRRRSY